MCIRIVYQSVGKFSKFAVGAMLSDLFAMFDQFCLKAQDLVGV